ncbi:MAG: translation elongation factor Ts [Thermotogae bacterium]|nr:translation elongation factor Ts [Thermotogota bacterium]
MAKVDIKLIQMVREATGAGLMDVKKALEETGGDVDKAIKLLRKMGIAKAEKKVARTTKEGLIFTALDENFKWGAVVEVGCETDFVARTDDFKAFGQKALEALLKKKANSVEELMDPSLEEEMKLLSGKVGEKIEIKKVAYFSTDDGMVYIYVHPGATQGAMVEIYPPNEEVALETAMQVTAMKPIAVSRDEFPEEVLQKEREIYEEQARKEGKPEKIIPRIVEGKLKAFLSERSLLDQPYMRDPKISFGEWLKKQGDYIVRRFVRFNVHED